MRPFNTFSRGQEHTVEWSDGVVFFSDAGRGLSDHSIILNLRNGSVVSITRSCVYNM